TLFFEILNFVNNSTSYNINDIIKKFGELSSKYEYAFYGYVNSNNHVEIKDVKEVPIIVKRYQYASLKSHKNPFTSYLNPPFGDNLYSILESHSDIYEESQSFFKEYGLDLLMDTEYEKIEIQKKIGSRVYKIPYSLVADTLQRIIFHLAAIDTNENSVLLFEEPENHSYPEYISLLADKIISNKANQFFITTHSPYLLKPFIEKCGRDEVGIFITTYENYQTKVRELTEEEINNIMETGIDIFYNISAFQK
ncbi:MAG TPA: AAA family ATPase, partial [Ferruginibacter sp.]|nr:AAA family ATPase [Ferruginibacter sp.]